MTGTAKTSSRSSRVEKKRISTFSTSLLLGSTRTIAHSGQHVALRPLCLREIAFSDEVSYDRTEVRGSACDSMDLGRQTTQGEFVKLDLFASIVNINADTDLTNCPRRSRDLL